MAITGETFWNESVIKMTECLAVPAQVALFSLSPLPGGVTPSGTPQMCIVSIGLYIMSCVKWQHILIDGHFIFKSHLLLYYLELNRTADKHYTLVHVC